MNNWSCHSIDTPQGSHLYRIMPSHRLIEILQNNKIVLVKPTLWEDPYENYILRTQLTHLEMCHDGKYYERCKRILDSIFCLCWTSKRESDAMWRIYSQNKSSVRIRVNANTLIKNIIKNNKLDLTKQILLIGRVKYIKK